MLLYYNLGTGASLGAEVLPSSDAGAAVVETGRVRPANNPRRPNGCNKRHSIVQHTE